MQVGPEVAILHAPTALRVVPRSAYLVQLHARASALDGHAWLPDWGNQAPRQGNRLTPARAFCLGPDEWLLISYSAAALKQRLRAAAGLVSARITDFSGRCAFVRVSGSAARSILAMCAGRAAEPGSYSRIRLAGAGVFVHCTDVDGCEIHVEHRNIHQIEKWLAERFTDLKLLREI